MKINFYERLLKILSLKEISWVKFYQDTGIPKTTVQYWKKGNLPGSEAVIKISEYLHVSIDLLLTGSEKYTSNCSEQSATILELLNNVDDKLTEIKKILI